MSPHVAPNSPVAPPPWSPLLATPSWHALRLLVSSLPRSLPPLPPLPAPPCLPCVEGRQRAAPHSSSFPPTTAPLQTLHMDVWGLARVTGQGRKRYFLLVVDDYTLRCASAQPLASCLLAGDLADTVLDGGGWRCVGVPDPLPGTVPVKVAVDPCAARGAASGGAKPGGAESEGAGSGCAKPGGAEPTGVERGDAEPEGVEPGGAEYEGAESGDAEPRGTASSGDPAILRHDYLPCRSLSPRSSCASG
ncbi:unnamed protein product [Closterium sp. NIES-53]